MIRLARLAALGVVAALVVRVLDVIMGPALPGLLTLMLAAAIASVILSGRWAK